MRDDVIPDSLPAIRAARLDARERMIAIVARIAELEVGSPATVHFADLHHPPAPPPEVLEQVAALRAEWLELAAHRALLDQAIRAFCSPQPSGVS